MGENSSIEWTEATWNPTRGCTRVSEGCRHCYAELIQARFDGRPGFGEGFGRRTKAGSRWTGKVELDRNALGKPERWKKPRMIFVDSMSDLWHESLSRGDIAEVYGVMEFCDWHTFQVLTKRPDRRKAYLQEWVSRHSWPILRNVWEGTSVENRAALARIDDLRATPAAVRFLSIEPLLEDLEEIDLEGIHWVIVGGESGPGARPMHPDWARSVRDQCLAADVKFFFKQWGEFAPVFRNGGCADTRYAGKRTGWLDPAGHLRPWNRSVSHEGETLIYRFGKKAAGRELEGRTWDEMPCRP